ncbi:MAG: hypothetical protein CVU96_04310 [Firmicutes bacterium HGW-Firmicutes-20]|jgi:hypothetical protein|nr:MAG: hypothetical protein CVU96_04310 [Firmicutes bacterium HGW-Firmicutes-20]PKM89136.1 MAG: hypothetical protein CVU85_03095 [Firmicutes bacterium HGW-Firmicutes-10]
MKKAIISCAVFEPYLKHLLLNRDDISSIVFLEVKQHNHPEQLAILLQEEINKIHDVDEILVMYGLCGNAILPLKSSGIPIRLLKVHDCGMVLAGSRQRYKELFAHRLSQSYACAAYDVLDSVENYRMSLEYLRIKQEYGEENAEYVLEMLHKPKNETTVYFDFGLDEDQRFLNKNQGRPLEVVAGGLQMMQDFIDGKDKDSVVLNKNEELFALYDLDEVFVSKEK